MDSLIDSIHAALAADASDEMKTTGATACRTILAALEPAPREVLGAALPALENTRAAPGTTLPPAAAIAAAVSALRGLPPEQLLDMAITRLKAALPQDAGVAPVRPLNFRLLSVPPKGGRR